MIPGLASPPSSPFFADQAPFIILMHQHCTERSSRGHISSISLLLCMQRHISFLKHLDISVIEHFPLLGMHGGAPAWYLFCATVMNKLVNRRGMRNGLSTDQEIDLDYWSWALSEGGCHCFIDYIYSIAVSIQYASSHWGQLTFADILINTFL